MTPARAAASAANALIWLPLGLAALLLILVAFPPVALACLWREVGRGARARRRPA